MPTPSTSAFPAATDDSFANANQPFPSTGHSGYNPDFPSAPFFGQVAQQQQPAPGTTWPSDSLFDLNNVELFAGFDIPFWLDDEQYVPFLDHGGN